MYSQISLKTTDQKTLSSNFFDVENPKGGVVYLHMMPATKESFTKLAERLQDLGWRGIAIDFRGHGNSEGGPDGYLNFSEEEHQKKYFDVLAALDYLLKSGLDKKSISIVGASIGANLGLKLLAQDPEIKKAVLLSPGLSYRGITTKNLVTKLTAGKEVFFIGSEDDNYTKECIDELFGLVPEGVVKQKQIYKEAGHGTTILERAPDSFDIIINFIIND
jgi:pimeloyl-ACP methyl ester carboxylesterase